MDDIVAEDTLTILKRVFRSGRPIQDIIKVLAVFMIDRGICTAEEFEVAVDAVRSKEAT